MTAVSLLEFLEARLAEDEADVAHIDGVNWSAARVLAEVAAKRAIVEEFSDENLSQLTDEELRGAYSSGLVVLRALACVYRDHPDYDEGWTL